MTAPEARPRLLWPSSDIEARLELERVGAASGWNGPPGPPPRSGRPNEAQEGVVSLFLPESLAADLRASLPLSGMDAVGEPGRGMIVTGRTDRLITWLENTGNNFSEAVRALRFGTGLEVPESWRFGERSLSMSGGTRLMAIINTTPDSFHAGSRAETPDEIKIALDRAVEGGADLIDIGGESTRPGAEPLTVETEIDRVAGAIEEAVARTSLPVSIDTTRSEVAAAALEAGAMIVNDISGGLDDLRMIPLVAGQKAGLVLMHRQGISASMQDDPRYDDLIGEIHTFLTARADSAAAGGVAPDRIAIDPGLGFGKRRQHNFEIYRRMAEFHSIGYPLLVGPSRKRHTSGPADRPAEDRLMGTAAAGAILAWHGAQIVRVHDVAEMRFALDTLDEIRGAVTEDRIS
ncbi:dihydropteroate synthase [Gemmatimonadota bacterium]